MKVWFLAAGVTSTAVFLINDDLAMGRRVGFALLVLIPYFVIYALAQVIGERE